MPGSFPNTTAKTALVFVGMWNVHKRLQYSFGEAYGLSIESEPDIGTTVTIRLPGPDSQK